MGPRTQTTKFLAILGLLALANVATAGLYDATILADNPAGYWRLGEAPGSATVADLTGNGHTGNVIGGGTTLGVPGAIVGDPDTAVDFPGSSGNKIDVPWSAQLNPTTFTVEVWARLEGGGGYRSPLTSRADGPQRGYIFYANPGSNWDFWNGKGGGPDGGWHGIGGGPITYNEWYHLVGTYDAATKTKNFYVNSILMSQATGVNLAVNPSSPLRIGAGASEGPGAYWFNGKVDEVAVYNHVLTSEQISNHFRAARAGGPNTYYPLLADFANPGGSGLGPDAAKLIQGGKTGGWPTPTNPDGMLVLGGSGSGSWLFPGSAIGDFDLSSPIVISTQAFYRDHDAPPGQQNAYFGLVALHRKGTGDSGASRRGGLWAQWQPATNGSGRMRIGFQSDRTGGGNDVWQDNAFVKNVSGFSDANGLFNMELYIGGLDDDDIIRFTVSQGDWEASLEFTLGAYIARLSSGSSRPCFLETLNALRSEGAGTMNIGFLSTIDRNDAYNYLYIRVIPEPASATLLGGALLALVARRKRKTH